jgi:hypothetical protein
VLRTGLCYDILKGKGFACMIVLLGRLASMEETVMSGVGVRLRLSPIFSC